jgi:tetratricopeptide (TPR) repeat protein
VSITIRYAPRQFPTGIFFWLALVSVWSCNCASAHGDLDIRIAAATQQIAQDTNNGSLYLQRAELHREHKDWAAAMTDYDRAASLDPKIPTVEFYRGRMLGDAGRYDDAIKVLDQYLARRPDDGAGFIERARIRSRKGDHRAAVTDFTRGLDLVSEPQPEYFLERSQALVVLGETNRALAGLDEGIKKLGPVVTLQVYAMDLELAGKKLDAAVARLNTIIPQAARKESWLARRGEIELEIGRLAQARESFEAALRAMDILPARLQLNRPMADLRARVNQLLTTITNGPAHSTTNTLK